MPAKQIRKRSSVEENTQSSQPPRKTKKADFGQMKKLVCRAAFGLGVAGSGTVLAEPWKPDAQTLFLSGFENSLREADFAIGPKGFYGLGATAAEGYFGRGIDLRGRALQEDFEGKCEEGQSAIFKHMALFTYGNVLPDEGTFEFFVQVEDTPKTPQPNHRNLLYAHTARFIEDGKFYLGAYMRLTRGRLEWRFPLWSRDNRDQWAGRYQFKPSLSRGWHHLALTWAAGEAVIYLDGRIIDTCNLKGKFGLTLFHHLNHGVWMGGHVLDELRISSVARYREDFEPNWRDGKRPPKAFKGNPSAKRYPAVYRPAPVGKFQAASSKLPGTAASLILLEGLERQPLKPGKIVPTGNGGFALDFAKGIKTSGKITVPASGVKKLTLKVRNDGKAEAKLECSLCFAALKNEVQTFDGADIKTVPGFETYRDSYPSILPLTAVSDQAGNYRAAALDPAYPLNDLITARKPGVGSLQGTKFVLSQGESFTLHFVLLEGKSRFGTAAALDQYYGLFKHSFKMDKSNTIYHYLPLTMHWGAGLTPDYQRQGYGGAYWGHGPYHTKGDETGNFWGKYPDEPSFQHALGNEKTFQSRKQLLEAIKIVNRYEYDNGYGVRRYHANPDLTAPWLIRELDPTWKPEDDPLNMGHYYKRTPGHLQFFTNEYNTKFGKFFIEESIRYYNAGMKDYSIGWINDTIYATSTMRYNGPETVKVPGRSFSRDFAHYIRGAMGKQQRWDALSKLKSRGYPMSVVSDGGSFSYTMASCSIQGALESGDIFESLQGWNFLRNARYLHGEKPLAMHTMPEKIETARNISPDGVTPDMLRRAYNYNSEYLILFALEHALLLDPVAYMPGRQFIAEMVPLTVDAVLRGRKAVPGAVFSGKSWVRRSGDGINTLIVCGNASDRKDDGKLRIFREYFGGKIPLIASYFGGKVQFSADRESIETPVSIAPRRSAAFTTVGLIDHAEKASVSLQGDGIDVTVDYTIDNAENATLSLNGFGKLYQLSSLTVNGQKHTASAKDIVLAPGKNKVRAVWHNRALKFTGETWAKVLLFDGQKKPNFSIVADPGYSYRTSFYNLQLGYEYGTAAMYNEFVRCYDAEDGIFDNMPLPKWQTRIDPSTRKWQLVFNGKAKRNGVSIDTNKRLIHIDGTTPGNCRRNSMILLRLMDRRYPHLGMMMMSRNRQYDRKTGLTAEIRGVYSGRGMFWEKRVADFFMALSEPDFLFKPLLREEYSQLYTDNVTDFSGKYQMLTTPFIYEPTYGDDFVYGFTGDTREWQDFFKKCKNIIREGKLPKKKKGKEK